MNKVYRFSEEQLLAFLSEYLGVTLDATARESLLALLETLAEKGQLRVIE